MKTLTVIFTAVLMTSLFFTNVKAGNDPASDVELVRKGIVTGISYPESAQEKLIEGYVDLYFSIGEEGKLLIKNIEYSDPIFEAGIKEDLEKIKIEVEDVTPDKIYHLRIMFDLI